MKNEVISRCPICSKPLTIKSLHCDHCEIDINGEFRLSPLSLLNKEQLEFVEAFLINQGSIKAVEKELNVSYPTVKKMLNDVLVSLGYKISEEVEDTRRVEILDRLAKHEISYEEAMQLLKEIK
ncbi:MAG: DUF2089 domain-containing protein [Bacilli bacterium]|jgi:hypothetical protein|nr:DUF2089 domain-containing protein [Bacilli bacterium]MDD2682474.1 DUF2089 domain-containing protein [Bacilli bacterium]MDD3121421.1 DUF2089 domain-containing protein [Bacilli bacterium]MDD4063280.1 DUF2089 domain-containing protein [Bacilli bacterium]MDD4482162.1 DUF2089 domain-containing protein [Bacilli bacterium]